MLLIATVLINLFGFHTIKYLYIYSCFERRCIFLDEKVFTLSEAQELLSLS